MVDQIILRQGTCLISAVQLNCGEDRPLKVTSDGGNDESLWLAGHEFGPTTVIGGSSFESAYDAWIDDQATLDAAEVCEAYGLDSQDELDLAVSRGEYPELQEGYRYQSNCSGTGIVNVGHYEWLRELQHDDCKGDKAIRLSILSYDAID